jgi:hypothetical protein
MKLTTIFAGMMLASASIYAQTPATPAAPASHVLTAAEKAEAWKARAKAVEASALALQANDAIATARAAQEKATGMAAALNACGSGQTMVETDQNDLACVFLPAKPSPAAKP